MKSNQYDFNVWISEGILALCAYELEETGDGLQCRTDKFLVKDFEMIEQNHDVIAYLLDNEEWNNGDVSEWDEYDDWFDVAYLTQGDTPAIITEWVNNLPEYEVNQL